MAMGKSKRQQSIATQGKYIENIKHIEFNKKFWGLFHLSIKLCTLPMYSCLVPLVWCMESAQHCSLQHHEREIHRYRETVHAKLVCLVWSTILISHAGCRTWISTEHQTECHRWSRFFLGNQTCCLQQTCCCLICVWCKIEIVLAASFVFWSQKHKKSFATTCNKRCWNGACTWQFMDDKKIV